MGLSDRIFRRKSDQEGTAPESLDGTIDEPQAIPDATVILPPTPQQNEPQTMIIAGGESGEREHFPTPPPPLEDQLQNPLSDQLVPAPQEQPYSGNNDLATATPPPAAAPHRPGFRERGRLRRRLRYLKQVRELGYRDLGGLVFDQHRFERGDAALVEGKVIAIETLDREIRAIEEVLQLQTPYIELFIPGVSACARCGSLHGSDAHFCPHCGLAFGGPRSVAGLGAVGANSVYDVGQQQPAVASDRYNQQQPGSGPAA